jgi:hypothetical protein
LARSKKYKIQVAFYEGSDHRPDEWQVYVWSKGLGGYYVGARKIDHRPDTTEMEVIGREIIDEFIVDKSKEQKAVVNVRHP